MLPFDKSDFGGRCEQKLVWREWQVVAVNTDSFFEMLCSRGKPRNNGSSWKDGFHV